VSRDGAAYAKMCNLSAPEGGDIGNARRERRHSNKEQQSSLLAPIDIADFETSSIA
jgi:hypothetical protein